MKYGFYDYSKNDQLFSAIVATVSMMFFLFIGIFIGLTLGR